MYIHNKKNLYKIYSSLNRAGNHKISMKSTLWIWQASIQFTSLHIPFKIVALGSEWGINCFDEGCNQTQLDADIRGKMKKIYCILFGGYKSILDQRETFTKISIFCL